MKMIVGLVFLTISCELGFVIAAWNCPKGDHGHIGSAGGDADAPTLTSRVVGGHLLQSWDDAPYMVAIFKERKDEKGQFFFNCGGATYIHRYVITAAHCFDIPFDQRKRRVVVGASDIRESLEILMKTYQVIEVQNHTTHPGYNNRTALNDIALMQLSEEIKPEYYLHPLQLPPPNFKFTGLAEIAGYGGDVERTSRDPTVPASKMLSTIDVRIFSRSDCNKHWVFNPVAESHFCAGTYPVGGTGTCQGDSGGPLVCMKPGQPTAKYICGVASTGAGCGQPKPDAYTEVSQFTKWIESVAGVQKPLSGFSGAGNSVPNISDLTKLGGGPFMVALLTNNGTHNFQTCGGAIYNRKHIITAAHCLVGDPRKYRIGVGGIKQKTKRYSQLISAETYTKHPKFNDKAKVNDIGIIQLRENIKWTDAAFPVRLAPPGVKFEGKATFTGYKEDKARKIDRVVEMHLYNRSECVSIMDKVAWEEFPESISSGKGVDLVPASALCASLYPLGGTGICEGDSGSGLICKMTNHLSLTPGEYLCGVGSTVYACGLAIPNVFTEISQFTAWIEQTAGAQEIGKPYTLI